MAISTLLGRLISKKLLRLAFQKPMFSYVYILKSLKNDSFYVGHTTNLKRRFKEREFAAKASEFFDNSNVLNK